MEGIDFLFKNNNVSCGIKIKPIVRGKNPYYLFSTGKDSITRETLSMFIGFIRKLIGEGLLSILI